MKKNTFHTVAKNILRAVLIGGTIALVTLLALVPPEAKLPAAGLLILFMAAAGIIGYVSETSGL